MSDYGGSAVCTCGVLTRLLDEVSRACTVSGDYSETSIDEIPK